MNELSALGALRAEFRPMTGWQILLHNWWYTFLLIPTTIFWGGCVLLIPAMVLQPFVGTFKDLPSPTQRILVACAGAITVSGQVIYHRMWARLIRQCAVRVYDRGLEIEGIVRFHVERLSVPWVSVESLRFGHDPRNWLDRVNQYNAIGSDVVGSRLTVQLNDGSEHRFDGFRAYYSKADLDRFMKELARTD